MNAKSYFTWLSAISLIDEHWISRERMITVTNLLLDMYYNYSALTSHLPYTSGVACCHLSTGNVENTNLLRWTALHRELPHFVETLQLVINVLTCTVFAVSTSGYIYMYACIPVRSVPLRVYSYYSAP